MPAKPQDAYNPVPTVTPQTGSGNDYLDVKATPASFGGQIAQSEEHLGTAGEEVGQEAAQFALKRQAMVHETLANQTEGKYIVDSGKLKSDFQSKEGLAADAALPKYQADMLALRQQYRGSLPLGAQKMFDASTTRHEAYALSDANTYATSQVKKANLDSYNSLAQNAIDSSGNIDIASNDRRFGENVGTIQHAVNSMVEQQGYGAYSHTENGKTVFDDSPEGQQAKQVYTAELEKRLTPAYENRFSALANQNVMSAYQKYQSIRSEIPGSVQVKLDSFFTPKVKDYQQRTITDAVLGQAQSEYGQTVSSPEAAKGVSIEDAIHNQESGGRSGAPTSANGAVGGFQILPATFTQYAHAGEDINKPEDNATVGKRIIADYNQKYDGDPARVAVAYFSGPGNVSQPGSPTPWVNDTKDANGKSVSSYVQDISNKTQTPSSSLADYYRGNYTKILNQALATAQEQHPDDPAYAQGVRQRVEQRLNDTIRQQELDYKKDNDMVIRAMQGDFSDGKKPSTIEQLTAVNPDIKAAWTRVQSNSPLVAGRVEQHLGSSDPDSKKFGGNWFNVFRSIHGDPNDPNSITTQSQLMQHVSKDGSDLTIEGFDHLSQMMAKHDKPEDRVELEAQKLFFDHAKNQIAGRGAYADPKGEELYTNFWIKAQSEINRLKADGKSTQEIFSSDSKDYLGKLIPAYKRQADQALSDKMADKDGKKTQDQTGIITNVMHYMFGGAKNYNTNTPEGLKAAVAAGMPRAQAEQIAEAKGWARRAEAGSSVPMAQ